MYQARGIISIILLLWPSMGHAESLPVQYRAADGAEMVFIPGGEFIMGSSPEEGFPDEHPAHKAMVSPFFLDRYEVCNRLYQVFDPKHSYPPGQEEYPAVMISWEQAEAYAAWAGKRLPTEVEWEYAATGGGRRRFPWGNEWDTTRANWNEGGEQDGYNGPAPVDSFPGGVSPFGVFNLSGNVWEWVQDTFRGYPPDSPLNPREVRKVLRGGAWDTGLPSMLRTHYRECRWPRHRHDAFGFRCALDAPAVQSEAGRGENRNKPSTPDTDSN